MNIVFNSSPLIVLSQLDFLGYFLNFDDTFYLPQSVVDEINADFTILDDAAARREAQRLGLNVRGTLAIIRKLHVEQTITIDNWDTLHLRLVEIGFRVKRLRSIAFGFEPLWQKFYT